MCTTFQTVEALSRHYRHIYLEPHLDDIALSCGGLVALQTSRGEATLVVTFFAGNPGFEHPFTPFAAGMHAIWGDQDDMVAIRHDEQRAALDHLGADWLRLNWFDAIYRDDRYLSDEQLFGTLHGNDLEVVQEIRKMLKSLVDRVGKATWYVPLAVGHHVDHQILLNASDVLGDRLGFEDYPYASRTGSVQAVVEREGALPAPEVDITCTIDRKIEAIACYQSQIGNLFGDDAAMRNAVRAFGDQTGTGNFTERYWLLAASQSID